MTNEDYYQFKQAVIVANRDIELMKKSVRYVNNLREYHKFNGNKFTESQLKDIKEISETFLFNEYIYLKDK